MSPSCAEVRDAFLRGELPEGTALAAHVAECPECRELTSGGAELGRALSALASNGEQRELELSPPSLARETGLRAYLRARPTRVRVALIVSAVVLVAGVSFALNGRDLRATPMARLYGVVALYTLGVWLAARRGLTSAADASYQRYVRALALGSLAAPALIALASGSMTAPAAGPLAALACFVYGALWAAPVAMLFFMLERSDPPPRGAFWLVAALIGFAANLVLELHCPNRHPAHLLLGHAAIGVVALGVALLYGRRASRARL